jgi:hypothetical protein
MKYLSKYKIFENFEEDKNFIGDVLLELEDKGFSIQIKPDGLNGILMITEPTPYFVISVSPGMRTFTFSDVKDELLTIKSYLEDKWITCGVLFSNNIHSSHRIRVDIDEKDYDLLDNWFDTKDEGIINLAVFFQK